MEGVRLMKICYIPPKKQKQLTEIKLYGSSIMSFFTLISRVQDTELLVILLACVGLAIVAAAQNVLMQDNKTDKWDKMLAKHEKQKKITKMLEEIEEEKTSKECQNVNAKNLLEGEKV